MLIAVVRLVVADERAVPNRCPPVSLKH